MFSEFEAVFNDHYQRLFTMVFRMTGNKEDAEDVLQTAFFQAYKAFDTFRNESSVYTWLYRIVLNAARKFYKKEARLPVDEYSEEHNITLADAYAHINQYGMVEDEAAVNMVRETCLQMFMNCMPAKYRAVYTLRVMLHFSVNETSRILEISESTVKVHLHRARKIAKDHMDGRCSLIKPGSLCDCRSYAKYSKTAGTLNKMLSIQTIKNSETEAVRRFNSELEGIAAIDALFDNQIKAGDYREFLNNIKKLRDDDNFTLLQ